MLPKLKRYPIAVDIQSDAVCALQLKNGRRGLVVKGTYRWEGDTPGTDPSEDVTWLEPVFQQIRRHPDFSGRGVAVHLPENQIFSLPLRF